MTQWNWAKVVVPVDCKGQRATATKELYLDLNGDGVTDAAVLANCPASVHSNGVTVYDGKSKKPLGSVGGASAAWGVITGLARGERADTFQVTVPDLEGQEYPATVRTFAVKAGAVVKVDEYVTAPD